MNKKMIGLAYGLAASDIFMTPKNGNSTSGSMAVMGMGTASVTHHVIIQAATPITR